MNHLNQVIIERELLVQDRGDKMTREEHIEKHKQLHNALDELVADYITQTGKRLTTSNLMELIEWSFQQTINPEDLKDKFEG